MTTTNDTAVPEQLAAAVQSVQPVWADDALTEIVNDPGDPHAVRFSVRREGLEVYQWAEEANGVLSLTGQPYFGPHTLPDLDEASLEEIEELGKDLARLAQFVAASLGTATDIRMLTLTDLRRLAEQDGIDVGAKYAALRAEGLL